MKLKQGVVAFAFGVPETIRSNRNIADLAKKMADARDAEIYTQSAEYLDFGNRDVTRIDEQPRKPAPNTSYCSWCGRVGSPEGYKTSLDRVCEATSVALQT